MNHGFSVLPRANISGQRSYITDTHLKTIVYILHVYLHCRCTEEHSVLRMRSVTSCNCGHGRRRL